MDKSVETYLKAIKNLTKLNANWLPTTSINLGDYGTLVDNVFNRIGNIKDDFRIPLKTINGECGNLVYKSKNKVTLLNNVGTSISEPSVGQASANYEMSFLTNNGFLFQALNGVQKEIKNIKQIGETLLRTYQRFEWKSEYVVVTKLVEAPNTTVILFKEKNASVVLSANVETSDTDVLQGSVGFGFKHENNLAFSFIGENNIKPLIGLHRIKLGLFREDNFEPITDNQFFQNSFRIIIPNFRNRKTGSSANRSRLVHNMEGSVRNRVRKYNAETLDPAYVYKNSTLNQNILKHSYRKQALLLSKSRVAVTQNMIVGGRSYKAISPSYNEIKLIIHKMNGKGYLLETAVFNENTKGSSLHSTGKRACSVAVFEKV